MGYAFPQAGASMTTEQVLSRLSKVRKVGSQYKALCPAHADKNPSLSIKQGDDCVLLRCHAGCDNQQIVDALGLRMADLFDKPIANSNGKSNGSGYHQPVAGYQYRDERGTLLYTKERFEPGLHGGSKSFVYRRPNSTDPGLGDVRRIPYGLNRLVRYDKAQVVCIAESERSCDLLIKEGLQAVAVGGANNWRSEWAIHFAGFHV